ncbi:MAG TPA: methyltransferase domain-containing protein [Kofleriaceae bacterium]|nr:methyltransferase domain-containing protein [Kofleriaceae bacterium]
MENAQAQTSFPDLYERLLVPAIFERYARDLVERALPIGPHARVLDLGCGTGIVARTLRDRLGGAAQVTGVDANAGMLAAARRIAPDLEWREGNAMALPFDDGAFDVVLCQEMLQFAPDRPAAVREMWRVLAPGGRLVLSTWRARSENPLHDALGLVAERHLGSSNDKRWSLGDAAALRTLLVDAGFTDVRLDLVSKDELHVQFPVRPNALAAGHDLTAWSDEERERRLAMVDAESATALARFTAPGGFSAPSRANVATARRPS